VAAQFPVLRASRIGTQWAGRSFGDETGWMPGGAATEGPRYGVHERWSRNDAHDQARPRPLHRGIQDRARRQRLRLSRYEDNDQDRGRRQRQRSAVPPWPPSSLSWQLPGTRRGGRDGHSGMRRLICEAGRARRPALLRRCGLARYRTPHGQATRVDVEIHATLPTTSSARTDTVTSPHQSAFASVAP
jgi:hypothetical protein